MEERCFEGTVNPRARRWCKQTLAVDDCERVKRCRRLRNAGVVREIAGSSPWYGAAARRMTPRLLTRACRAPLLPLPLPFSDRHATALSAGPRQQTWAWLKGGWSCSHRRPFALSDKQSDGQARGGNGERRCSLALCPIGAVGLGVWQRLPAADCHSSLLPTSTA
jgi:hypothetical protein